MVIRKNVFALLLGYLLVNSCNSNNPDEVGRNWPLYGGNREGNRYSPLDEINTSNVQDLHVAWIYNTTGFEQEKTRQIECQPIVVNSILYATNGRLELFALDAGTGKQLWKFDPGGSNLNVNRGVTYWENGSDKRILYTVGAKLFAINAKTGRVVQEFGKRGIVDLHEGLSNGLNRDISSLKVNVTSPGVIYKNTFITGSSVSESGNAAPGYVRGFDAVTGKLKWVFHTIPQAGEFGYDTWPTDAYTKIGGANNWGGLVVDEKRGTVYFGTGSPSSDFYGGERKGINLFANCVISLEAETGKMKWYYQTIHHDLWDRDIPEQPNLTTIKRNGKIVDVVVQATKDGLIYVLDRDHGTSVFPVEERAVPINGLPGEHPWPTQKFPLKPLPLSRQVFTEADISNISPEAYEYTKEQFLKYPAKSKFTPPNTIGTLAFGYSGGAEWGGSAIDPQGIFYQNANDNPWVTTMIDTSLRHKELSSLTKGNALFEINCSPCHGRDLKGNGTEFPSLLQIEKKRTFDQIQSILKYGIGRMPSFQQSLSDNERTEIIKYILNPLIHGQVRMDNEHKEASQDPAKRSEKLFGFNPAYEIKEWRKVFDPNGYPGVKPPWGTLNAIDLNTGDYLWRVPLGEFPELTKKGIPITGTESYGGPIVTAGGLVFIAGTRDEKIRAFDKKTGKVLWEYTLPAGGFATPITYEVNGKQFLVIAVGGNRGLKPGGKYIAFAF